MKKAIITGATSFLGFSLLNNLIEKDYNIFAVIRPGSQKNLSLPIKSNITYIELDMEEFNKIPSKINQSIDFFFHFAWEGTRGERRENGDLQNKNYINTLKTITAATQMNVSCFFGSGSQAEYGMTTNWVTESENEKPVSAYGKAKLNSYRLCKDIAQKNGFRFIWGRFFSLFGIGDFSNSLIMSSLYKMKNNEDIHLTECIQQWNYLYISDAINAIFKLVENNDADGIYNIAHEISRPLREYVLTMAQMTKTKSKIFFGSVPYPASGVVNLLPNISKIRRTIDWEPHVSFTDGINRIWMVINGQQENY